MKREKSNDRKPMDTQTPLVQTFRVFSHTHFEQKQWYRLFAVSKSTTLTTLVVSNKKMRCTLNQSKVVQMPLKNCFQKSIKSMRLEILHNISIDLKTKFNILTFYSITFSIKNRHFARNVSNAESLHYKRTLAFFF